MVDFPPIKPELLEGSALVDQKLNFLIQRYILSHENTMHVDWTISGPEVIHLDRIRITVTKNLGLELPVSGENKFFFKAPVDLIVQAVTMVMVGSTSPSLTMNIEWSLDRSDGSPSKLWITDEVITNVTTGDLGAAFDDSTIPEDSFVWFTTSAQSGTVDEMDLYLTYDES